MDANVQEDKTVIAVKSKLRGLFMDSVGTCCYINNGVKKGSKEWPQVDYFPEGDRSPRFQVRVPVRVDKEDLPEFGATLRQFMRICMEFTASCKGFTQYIDKQEPGVYAFCIKAEPEELKSALHL